MSLAVLVEEGTRILSLECAQEIQNQSVASFLATLPRDNGPRPWKLKQEDQPGPHSKTPS